MRKNLLSIRQFAIAVAAVFAMGTAALRHPAASSGSVVPSPTASPDRCHAPR